MVTRNIKNWAQSGKYEHLTLNKRRSKLKVWCSKTRHKTIYSPL